MNNNMRKEKAIAADTIVNRIRNGTLEKHLREYKENNYHLYLSYGIRAQIEENFTDEEQEYAKTYHTLLKEVIKQGLVINSRHKYTLEKFFKPLHKHLLGLEEKLNDAERHLVVLSLQLGIEIDTDDKRIINTINEIKTTTHLQKYAMKLMSSGTPV
jgi:hypothetical protein